MVGHYEQRWSPINTLFLGLEAICMNDPLECIVEISLMHDHTNACGKLTTFTWPRMFVVDAILKRIANMLMSCLMMASERKANIEVPKGMGVISNDN